MHQIKKMMETRKNYLLQLEAEKLEALREAPSGFLRICASRKRKQYYYRTNLRDLNGEYISDMELVRQLAQKRYDTKVISSIQKEIKAIENYCAACPGVQVEDVYERMHIARQELVVPVKETDEQYISTWENVQYVGKGFGEDLPEIYTERGERVRSKSEVIIADLLNKEGIPYRYECPLKITGRGIFYPDFTVLNVSKRKEIYWEHLGMMDDPVYVEKALHKIAAFEENGIMPNDNLILTFETGNIPLNRKVIKGMIDKYIL